VRFAAVRHRLHQHVDALGLSGATRAQGHHAVPDSLGLEQLNQLEDPGRVEDQTGLVNLHRNNPNAGSFVQVICFEILPQQLSAPPPIPINE